MSDETRLPEVSDTIEPETEEDELEASRKDGVGMLDDLIGAYYNRALETIEENFKPGDLMKLIELRYKLSPTTAEQIKFWQNLARIRQKTLKRLENRGKLKKTEEPKK